MIVYQIALYNRPSEFLCSVELDPRDAEALALAGNVCEWTDPRTGTRYQIVGSAGPAVWLGRQVGPEVKP